MSSQWKQIIPVSVLIVIFSDVPHMILPDYLTHSLNLYKGKLIGLDSLQRETEVDMEDKYVEN